jgi:hypothetical protein
VAGDGVERLELAAEAAIRAGVENELLAGLRRMQDVVSRNDLGRFGQTGAGAFVGCGDGVIDRALLARPFGVAAIQQGHAGVAEPAQHPPQPSGHGAIAVVVHHHLLVDADAPVAELFGQHARIGQRMAAGFFTNGCGEVVVQMHVACTRDVCFLVGLSTRPGIGEGEAAVQNDPVGIVQVCGQVFSGNEGIGKHE